MNYPHPFARAVPPGSISPMQHELAETLRQCCAPRRRGRQSWRVKDATRSRYALLGTFERVVDELLARGVPDEQILELARVIDRHLRAKLADRAVREQRALPALPSLAEACELETAAQGLADRSQIRALIEGTARSLGSLRSLLADLRSQHQATTVAIAATERELARHRRLS